MKITKILLATLGGADKVMSMFIPLMVALIIISITNTQGFAQIALVIIAMLSTLFRAIKVLIDD